MAHVLLTGAGFSRNWGGWLANEAFEYLIGSPEIDDHIRHLLWKHKSMGGGFEEALAELQQAYTHSKNDRTRKPLADLQAAIVGMFNYMNLAFDGIQFEPQKQQNFVKEHLIGTFLARFDAIFTLNQDLLLERHYLNDPDFWAVSTPRMVEMERRANAGDKAVQHDLPGRLGSHSRPGARASARPTRRICGNSRDAQPYYKLHGSTNWIGGVDVQPRLLIMGGNKAVEINQYPLLAWYHKQFDEYLARSTRLMVIGYSFSDMHINRAILKAAAKGDAAPVHNRSAGRGHPQQARPVGMFSAQTDLMALTPYIIGASRRPLLTTICQRPGRIRQADTVFRGVKAAAA